jgi:hypothetical protein
MLFEEQASVGISQSSGLRFMGMRRLGWDYDVASGKGKQCKVGFVLIEATRDIRAQ